MDAQKIYNGSDGEATRALYAKLETIGPAGIIGLNLFRAQKCSARAKGYRRNCHRSEAYGRKEWSLQNLCAVLTKHAEPLGIAWGWKEDPKQAYHCWVLYVVLPSGQVSFHAAAPIGSQRFTGEWDGLHESARRVVLYVSFLLDPEKNKLPPPSTLPALFEISMTDRIGDLNAAQIDHLSRGLEYAHGMTIKAATGGRYWLEVLEGGALMLTPHRTVQEIWNSAEAITTAAEQWSQPDLL